MNNKHLACIVLGLLLVLIFYGVMKMNDNLNTVRGDVRQKQSEAEQLRIALTTERNSVSILRRQSEDLREYLSVWEPHFAPLRTAQSSELNLNARIKEANLVSLSQRFEVVNEKDDQAIQKKMRAHLKFEDDYARLMNWLGQMETQIPVMRVSNVKLTKGEAGNDLRMELVLDLPLISQPQTQPQ